MRYGVSRVYAEIAILVLVVALVPVLVQSVPTMAPCDVTVSVVSMSSMGAGTYEIDGENYTVVKAYKVELIIRNACARPLTDVRVRVLPPNTGVTVCAEPSCDIIDPMSLPNAVPDTVPPNTAVKAVILLIMTEDINSVTIAVEGLSGGGRVGTTVSVST